MEGAVEDRAWADTSRKVLKGNVGSSCPELFVFGPLGTRTMSGKVLRDTGGGVTESSCIVWLSVGC